MVSKKVNVKQWAEFLRRHVRRERINFLVEWARENGVKNLQCIYEKARTEFPMAGEEKARSYTKAALKTLRKTKKTRMQAGL